jgi:4-methyl-5(b-hydroxyethyl)-thiazole monophosphate biosynthesis
MARKALVILADGCEEIEAVTIIDLLRRAGIEVTAAGLGKREITGSHDIVIRADMPLEKSFDTFDAVVLPGGMPATASLADSVDVGALISAAFQSGALVAAVCAAPLVLARAGILDNKRFTCYPGIEKDIAHGHCVAEPVVIDGNVITGRAAGTAIAFCLAIVEYLLDAPAANDLASKLLYQR